ncbi:protein EVI2B-like [Anoplopoma fimbria]|uniref:protein EVI2B-like n=1 Tax=Anoplopoma fimbria TaxID=229290 RepID=UPI0023ECBD23|nr:protein EVI2B-like [Anoplopoma fimbria]
MQQPARKRKKTMTIHFSGLLFMWLLPLTSGQNNNFSHVMTGTQVTPNVSTQDELTTQEASSLNPLSEVTGRHMTRSVLAQESGAKASSQPSLQTSPTTSSKTFRQVIQTAATPTSSTESRFKSSTEGRKSTTERLFNFKTSATTVATSHSSNPPKTTSSHLQSSTERTKSTTERLFNFPTKTTRAPPTPSSSATARSIHDRTTQPSSSPMSSSSFISTLNSSTKPVKPTTISTSPFPATWSTRLYKGTTKTPFKKTSKDRRPGEKADTNKGSNHSKVVAWLIGGALGAMLVGFLVIYIKKRKLQKQQITTTDWAGPSPFLEGGVDNGQVTLRSSNRVSLSGFLTQRLSKRLSLLPDTDEELEDMTAGSTFGGKHQETSFGGEANGKGGGESNGTAGVVPDAKSNEDAPETAENSNSKDANHNQDLSAKPPTPSADVETPPPAPLDDGLREP